MRHLAFITPGSLSSAHRDEVSRVSLEWTAVVIASTLISVGIRALALKPLNLETLGRSVHEILTAPSDPVS